MNKKIILIAGPTSSGKSQLALKLANKIKGEIINADSMQVYKEFSILSSKPNKQEFKNVKHHLYGIISVKKYFSVGDWLKKTKIKVNSCLKKKKIPYREFRFSNFNEQTLGELFSYFMIETILLGKLININPFDQPAVEKVKISTKKALI